VFGEKKEMRGSLSSLEDGIIITGKYEEIPEFF
jgi:hypothetical protein